MLLELKLCRGSGSASSCRGRDPRAEISREPPLATRLSRSWCISVSASAASAFDRRGRIKKDALRTASYPQVARMSGRAFVLLARLTKPHDARRYHRAGGALPSELDWLIPPAERREIEPVESFVPWLRPAEPEPAEPEPAELEPEPEPEPEHEPEVHSQGGTSTSRRHSRWGAARGRHSSGGDGTARRHR